jgi:DNA-binding response OmpR family regulator
MKTHLPAILLIEKDEVTLEIYQRELCNSFTVFSFMEMTGIAETLAQEDIQAIIIEPEIDSGQGWGWIESIQETLSIRDVPIIVCSTRDASRISNGQKIARYLTKPVLPKALRQNILEVLETKKRSGKSR